MLYFSGDCSGSKNRYRQNSTHLRRNTHRQDDPLTITPPKIGPRTEDIANMPLTRPDMSPKRVTGVTSGTMTKTME